MRTKEVGESSPGVADKFQDFYYFTSAKELKVTRCIYGKAAE